MNFPRHEPTAYSCPFCRVQRGEFDERNKAEDIIAVTDRGYARVPPKWWPAIPGAALVIPRVHVENLYEISAEDGHEVWDLTQNVAQAMRTSLDCAGTSIRQHRCDAVTCADHGCARRGRRPITEVDLSLIHI